MCEDDIESRIDGGHAAPANGVAEKRLTEFGCSTADMLASQSRKGDHSDVGRSLVSFLFLPPPSVDHLCIDIL